MKEKYFMLFLFLLKDTVPYKFLNKIMLFRIESASACAFLLLLSHSIQETTNTMRVLTSNLSYIRFKHFHFDPLKETAVTFF
jgi:hypothetical protein